MPFWAPTTRPTPHDRPGHVPWAASPLKEATCRGILPRRGRNFWPPPFFRPLYRAPRHRTEARHALWAASPLKEAVCRGNLLRCDRNFDLCLSQPPHATGQRPRHALSAASPLKETICSGILSRRGRNF